MIASETLRNFSGVMGMPLRRGDSGVEQTIDLIRRLVDDGVKDPLVNRTAIDALKRVNAPSFDRDAKLRALYDFVSWPNFLYVEDPVGPFGPKETVRPVRDLLSLRAGDCDDFTVLLAALAGTIGIPTRAVTVAADPSAPNDFSHIYPEAEVSPGRWIPLDAARPGAAYGVAPPFYFRKRVWNLTDSSFNDVKGADCGCGGACCTGQRPSSLNGYAILGDVTSDTNPAAQDISAIGQSVANVISASKGNPYGSFQTPYSPWTGYAGPYAPGVAVPAAGYPGGPSGVSISTSPNLLWALVVGGALLYAASRT